MMMTMMTTTMTMMTSCCGNHLPAPLALHMYLPTIRALPQAPWDTRSLSTTGPTVVYIQGAWGPGLPRWWERELLFLRYQPSSFISLVSYSIPYPYLLIPPHTFWLSCHLFSVPSINTVSHFSNLKPFWLSWSRPGGREVLCSGMYLTHLLLMYLGQMQGLNKEIWGRMSKRLLLTMSRPDGRREVTIGGEISLWVPC